MSYEIPLIFYDMFFGIYIYEKKVLFYLLIYKEETS
jgi:hypothetical protein